MRPVPLPDHTALTATARRFKDREGNVNDEYMSLFADDVALVQGRTPLQIYRDFMQAFRDALQTRMGSLVTEVMVGLGPSGELRYPSYPSTHWQFCGVGEFQCYDKYALQSITAAAIAQGRPDWGYGGPGYAGASGTGAQPLRSHVTRNTPQARTTPCHPPPRDSSPRTEPSATPRTTGDFSWTGTRPRWSITGAPCSRSPGRCFLSPWQLLQRWQAFIGEY